VHDAFTRLHNATENLFRNPTEVKQLLANDIRFSRFVFPTASGRGRVKRQRQDRTRHGRRHYAVLVSV
jgi:hypothetical protein